MATGKGDAVFLWSLENFELLKKIDFHDDRIIGYQFTTESKELIPGTSRGKIIFIDIQKIMK